MARPPTPHVKLVRKRLDEAGVKAHFDRLAAEAAAVEIRVKTAAAGQSAEESIELEAACRRLVAGDLIAVQIRFHQQGAWWCDTVMRVRDDYRLVRMRQS